MIAPELKSLYKDSKYKPYYDYITMLYYNEAWNEDVIERIKNILEQYKNDKIASSILSYLYALKTSVSSKQRKILTKMENFIYDKLY